ncbi:MAG: MFS transporter [Chloroflexota bacterium]
MTTSVAAAPVPMSAAEEAAYKRRWIALILLSLSLMLIVIDSTIVNIAFPAIQSTFKASYADAEWVNSIYSLVFGAALITWGKLGDQYGRRNIFILGAIVFVLGSLGTGLAGNIGVLVLFRAVQGMGGAMMSPSTLSIISSTFRGKERGTAFGIWGATAGVSAALGPILGGWLIEYGTGITAESWRLAFLINVPVGIIAVVGAFWAIREVRDRALKHHIDVLGIILASVSLGSIVFGAIEGQNYGWLEAKKVFTIGSFNYPQLADGVTQIPAGTTSFIPIAFVLGIITLILFVIWEVRQERNGGEPLFEFGLLRYPSFRYGLLTVSIVALGEFGVVLVLSIFFQLAKGLGAFETGLRFLPFALVMIIAAPTAGVLSGRFGAKWVITIGMFCEAAALFWISRILYVNTSYLSFLPAFSLYGFGLGLAIAQLANVVLSDIPPDKAGAASGANNTLRQLGASLGIAIIGAVMFGTFASESKPLIEESTLLKDFGARVEANDNISKSSKAFAALMVTFDDTFKKKIEDQLDANEGFGSENADVIQSALDNAPPGILKLQGIDMNNPETVATLKTELEPDAVILTDDLQHTLGEGFSTAGRAATSLATVFVAGGAISSLMLPKGRKPSPGEEQVVVAGH